MNANSNNGVPTRSARASCSSKAASGTFKGWDRPVMQNNPTSRYSRPPRFSATSNVSFNHEQVRSLPPSKAFIDATTFFASNLPWSDIRFSGSNIRAAPESSLIIIASRSSGPRQRSKAREIPALTISNISSPSSSPVESDSKSTIMNMRSSPRRGNELGSLAISKVATTLSWQGSRAGTTICSAESRSTMADSKNLSRALTTLVDSGAGGSSSNDRL